MDLEPWEVNLLGRIVRANITMVPLPKLVDTMLAAKHVVESGVPGDFVECGVWRGGNAILAKSVFEFFGSDKRVWLYDTFTGMTEPSEVDVGVTSAEDARSTFFSKQRETHNDWCYASLDDVISNSRSFGVDMEGIRFIEGDVSQTLKEKRNLPDQICILRLDTDWYESTKVELEVLYPLLSKNGVLLVDDYGHWSGQKKAVDEYFEFIGLRPFLGSVAEGFRCMLKTS